MLLHSITFPFTPITQSNLKPLQLIHPPILKTPFTPSKPTPLTTKTHTTPLNSSTLSQNQPSHTDWEEEEIGEDDDDADVDSPWEGAITYRRNASVSHLEHCTTLERLGLGRVSSDVSRMKASEMGLRVVGPAARKGCSEDGTPVLISMDVVRRKKRLRIDGIVRTVISLACNSCGELAAQSVYSDFSLLLCEEPIREPETINLGTIFGEDKSNALAMGEDEDDDDAYIDIDDQLYFPVDEKEIDISKNIRDLIHVEITISAVCDPNCKGLCLNCGTNLNIGKCTCKKKVQEKGYGPLGDLRKQMQQT